MLGNGDFKAIETIQVGDRVQTKQFNQKPESEADVDEDWLVITVRIPSQSGHTEEAGECVLLKSKAWIDKHYSKEKKAVWLQFGETQTIGWYPVLSINKASKPKTGNGRLVLSTINRVVNNVFELKIVGQSETIKGTGNHKFWSEDRQDWVPLRALKLGERLLLKSAVKAHVEWVKRVAGKFRVYNFEVQGVHNYYVGQSSILVHNPGTCLEGVSNGAGITIADAKRLRRESVGRPGNRWESHTGLNGRHGPKQVGGGNAGHPDFHVASQGVSPSAHASSRNKRLNTVSGMERFIDKDIAHAINSNLNEINSMSQGDRRVFTVKVKSKKGYRRGWASSGGAPAVEQNFEEITIIIDKQDGGFHLQTSFYGNPNN